MDLLPALLAIALLVLVTAVLAFALTRRQVKVKRTVRAEAVAPAELSAERFGDTATLVQFSTEFCSKCPATRRLLGTVAQGREGVEFVEVDLTNRRDLAARFQVLQTPTILILDREGVPQARFGGPAARPAIETELDRITGAHHVGV